jgi:hypothetical protein
VRVLLTTRDLFFRSKLAAVAAAGGADVVTGDAACDLVVLDVEAPGAQERIRGLVERGVAVLAYGPHVRAELLRAAREAGATAVPNSQVEQQLRHLLATST